MLELPTTLFPLMLELNQVRDLDVLLVDILSGARRLLNADAGSIYIRHGSQLHFSYTQNDTLSQSQLANEQGFTFSNLMVPIGFNGSIAGYVTAAGELLNIVDAYDIGSSQPYRFNRQFDKESGYQTQSVLTVPLKTIEGHVLGVLQIINKIESGHTTSFTGEDESTITHFANIATIALERAKLARVQILRIMKAVELNDPEETGSHVQRVGRYAVEIYKRLAAIRRTPPEVIRKVLDTLQMGAMLHDAGKVAIPHEILKKEGKLSDQETQIMRTHTTEGAKIFEDSEQWQLPMDTVATQIVAGHHERWDGYGYPHGKKQCEIPLSARITSTADVYDALRSERSYKEPWSHAQATDEISKNSGTQFDPEVVSAFLAIPEGFFQAVRDRYP